MKKTSTPKQNPSEIILYQAEEGKFQLALSRDSDSIWLNLNQIADLYQTSVPNISMHIRNILKDGELDPDSTVKKYLTVQTENDRHVRRKISFYSLEMILAIGYRVRSERGTQFRIWATQHLSEYLKKGFTLDDELGQEATIRNYRIVQTEALQKPSYSKTSNNSTYSLTMHKLNSNTCTDSLRH